MTALVDIRWWAALIYWGPRSHFRSLASRSIHRFPTFTFGNSTSPILIHGHTQGIVENYHRGVIPFF